MAWVEQGVSQERQKAEKEKIGGRWQNPDRISYIKQGTKVYVPRDGENQIRIVQPREIVQLGYHYAMDVHFHRNVGPNQGDYLCLKRMAPVLAPLELAVRALCYECAMQTPELWETDRDLAKTYFPDWRKLMLVVDLLEPEGSEKYWEPLLWSCPKTLAEDIIGASHKKATDVFVDVSHPLTGVVVFFDRFGKGKETKYKNVQIGEEPYPLDEYIDQARPWIKDCLIIPAPEEVQAAQNGMETYTEDNTYTPDGDGGGEEDFQPTGTNCPECGEPQFETPSGICCPNGHGGEEGEEAVGVGEEDVAAAEAAIAAASSGKIRPEPPEGMTADYEECFATEAFDTYEECDPCPYRELCDPAGWPSEPPPAPKKTAKAPAPKKTAKTPPPSLNQGAAKKTPPAASRPAPQSGKPPAASRPGTGGSGSGVGNAANDVKARLAAAVAARKKAAGA